MTDRFDAIHISTQGKPSAGLAAIPTTSNPAVVKVHEVEESTVGQTLTLSHQQVLQAVRLAFPELGIGPRARTSPDHVGLCNQGQEEWVLKITQAIPVGPRSAS